MFVVAVGTSQTAQFRAMGIVLGANRHLKDVTFVREFWWGTYSLGAMSPRKTPISVIDAINWIPLAIYNQPRVVDG